jgi:hypothetical protein
MKQRKTLLKSCLFSACASMLACQPVYADEDGWNHNLAIYMWGTEIEATTVTGDGVTVEFSDILDNLEMAFMGAYAARKGKWSILGDLIYSDVEGNKRYDFDPPLTGSADATLGLKALSVQAAAGYELYNDNEGTVTDVIVGLRYLDISNDLSLRFDVTIPEIDPEIGGKISGDSFDAFVGLHGKTRLGKRWFLPWVTTVGAGESDLTWSVAAGIGYNAADWADIVLGYRYMKWEMDDKEFLADYSMSGPLLGAVFRF